MNIILFPFSSTVLKFAYWTLPEIPDNYDLVFEMTPDIIFLSIASASASPIEVTAMTNLYVVLTPYYNSSGILLFAKKERINVISFGSFFLPDNQTQIFQMNILLMNNRQYPPTCLYFLSPFSNNVQDSKILSYIDEMHKIDTNYIFISPFSKKKSFPNLKNQCAMKKRYNVHSAMFLRIYEKKKSKKK